MSSFSSAGYTYYKAQKFDRACPTRHFIDDLVPPHQSREAVIFRSTNRVNRLAFGDAARHCFQFATSSQVGL